jgi:hypothetical protein
MMMIGEERMSTSSLPIINNNNMPSTSSTNVRREIKLNGSINGTAVIGGGGGGGIGGKS